MRNQSSPRQGSDGSGSDGSPPNEALIVVEHVTFVYPTPGAGPRPESVAGPLPAALDDVTLHIRRGEYVALLGHNGSGKSTLARLLNGLLVPDHGSVRVAGLDTRILAARQRVRERVGMIFSDPDNQIIATIVEDDVGWALAARGYARALIATRVDAALAAVGLTEMRHLPPHELSGGQRQRLAIAGVLALSPNCVVADEPTALLDPLARREMGDLLRQLHHERELTIVHVTHLLEEAARADRIVILADGRIALEGPPAAVFGDLDRLRALRLVVPEVALLGERLRAVGIAVPPEAVTPETLASALGQREARA
ncbi:MAG: ATP-binding cassette domain-containing protein [Ktedonobacterales bacterium]|nr:ATP-binding cassette domain-containing protein [Ktedonobacterales bacterium]